MDQAGRMAEMYRQGAERKMSERERYLLMSATDASRSVLYLDLADFLDTEIHLYRMAELYYRQELDSIDEEEQLMLSTLIPNSDPVPRLYAQYLRSLTKVEREAEMATHKDLAQLKGRIMKAMGES